MHDLVIRNGTLYDGTGAEPVIGDLALDGAHISAVGAVAERGRRELDASGQIVTPGFVDCHTHFDGQVTWDPYLSPSSWHGVTTVVMGNCGVGFAPCRSEQRDWLIGLMEGVEDIPGSALAEGIKWRWQSFPEFMDAVAELPLALDVGLQVPHGAVRAWVMGQRGADLEPATAAEREEMAALVAEALRAGALGFSTSRTEKHRDKDGAHTPTYGAAGEELHAIAAAMGREGKGVIQLIADFRDFDYEFGMIRRMVKISSRPLSMTIEQDDRHPDIWRKVLAGISAAAAGGLPMRGQVPARATGVLQGLSATLNPFLLNPVYWEIADKPLAERVQALRQPEFRRRLLAQPRPGDSDSDSEDNLLHFLVNRFDKMFAMTSPPDYEPNPSESLAARAARDGVDAAELALDLMLEDDGKALLYFPLFNYLHGNLDDVHQMLTHPHCVFGLGDAGAHCGVLCDASFPTTLLTHWGRDRSRGPRIELKDIIHGQTQKTAHLVGLHDRGALKPGLKADVNIIDFDNLSMEVPHIVADLPAGGKRLVQRTQGYTATLVDGQVAFEQGEPTGVLNGRLIRGAQSGELAAGAA